MLKVCCGKWASLHCIRALADDKTHKVELQEPSLYRGSGRLGKHRKWLTGDL